MHPGFEIRVRVAGHAGDTPVSRGAVPLRWYDES